MSDAGFLRASIYLFYKLPFRNAADALHVTFKMFFCFPFLLLVILSFFACRLHNTVVWVVGRASGLQTNCIRAVSVV